MIRHFSGEEENEESAEEDEELLWNYEDSERERERDMDGYLLGSIFFIYFVF